jgi:hypothetical protein
VKEQCGDHGRCRQSLQSFDGQVCDISRRSSSQQQGFNPPAAMLLVVPVQHHQEVLRHAHHQSQEGKNVRSRVAGASFLLLGRLFLASFLQLSYHASSSLHDDLAAPARQNDHRGSGRNRQLRVKDQVKNC